MSEPEGGAQSHVRLRGTSRGAARGRNLQGDTQEDARLAHPEGPGVLGMRRAGGHAGLVGCGKELGLFSLL